MLCTLWNLAEADLKADEEVVESVHKMKSDSHKSLQPMQNLVGRWAQSQDDFIVNLKDQGLIDQMRDLI